MLEHVTTGHVGRGTPVGHDVTVLLTAGRHHSTLAPALVLYISHRIEETDAGLDRRLYLRNKLYDKTLKS